MIVARTPYRITLAGGGTDIPSFYEDHGGFVVSMAIDKYIHVLINKNMDRTVKMRYKENETVDCANLLCHDRAREILVTNDVLNGVEVISVADLPDKSGAGSSGSFLVAMSAAIKKFKDQPYELRDVCEEACSIEINKLKLPTGKQDQYIAGYGGIKTFDISTDGKVKVSDIIDKIDYKKMIEYMNVYKIGNYRNASDVLKNQNNKNRKTVSSLINIKSMAYDFLDLLKSGDFDGYGKLLDTYWQEKRRLSSKISNSFVDDAYKTSKEKYGVLGGKILGAGGGGFLLLFSPPSKELDIFMDNLGMKKLNFNVSRTGLQTQELL